ncbi:MAG: hypothetical protein JWN63_109, partial [Candidatus Acidoferrum typicum]|nr:hypothetical protein [Candidatus Acidoferrum typicum]
TGRQSAIEVLATANTQNAHASAKSDPPGPDAARSSRVRCVCRFGARAGCDTKEIRFFQISQLFASGEVIEKIAAPGAGAESPYSRPHFRDPTGARERRFVHWKTERKMGRFYNGSNEKIPGSAWAESDGEARCENPSAIGAWLSDHRCCAAHASHEFFDSAENDTLSDGPPPAVIPSSSRLHSIQN